MLLTAIYHMLKNGESFAPSDYETYQKPERKRLNEANAIELLGSLGYDIFREHMA